MKLKKFLFTCISSTALLLAIYTVPTFAEPSFQIDPQQISSSARAEQIEWRYRTYKGKKQRRLWSITYEKWLTDWMPA